MLFVSLNERRAWALWLGLREAQLAILSCKVACSLAGNLSKLLDTATHLFFCAALNCAQCGAKGAKAIFCWALRFCQVASGILAALFEVAGGKGLELCDQAKPIAKHAVATKIWTRTRLGFNPQPFLGWDWT